MMSPRSAVLAMPAFLAFALHVQSQADTRSDIRKLGVDYPGSFGDVKAKITYWGQGETPLLVFTAVGPNKTTPPLKDQCRMFEQLLDPVLKQHPSPKYDVSIGTMRDGLMEPLDRYLLASPGWDSGRGQAKAGPAKSYSFVTESIAKSRIADPIAKAFAAYGYSFQLTGIGKMNVQKLPAFQNARLPEFIWEWYFVAHKQGDSHGSSTAKQ